MAIETYRIAGGGRQRIFLEMDNLDRDQAVIDALKSIGAVIGTRRCLELNAGVPLDVIMQAVGDAVGEMGQRECIHVMKPEDGKIKYQIIVETNTKDVKIVVGPPGQD